MLSGVGCGNVECFVDDVEVLHYGSPPPLILSYTHYILL